MPGLQTGLRIGYLISRYPAISHTFVLREVMALKRLGFDIRVASINRADRCGGDLTVAEQTEQAGCFYVKQAAQRFAVDLLWILCTRPVALIKSTLFALRANGADLAKASKNLLYLAEAVLVARWMRRLKLTHLHVHFATPAATVGLLACQLMEAGFSITVHGPDEFYETAAYLLPQKCSQARFLCAISDFAASQLQRMMPVGEWPKIKVTPLGVDLEQFSPGWPVRPERDQSKKEFQLLCVGRLVAAKGQHVLLEAVSLLRQAGRNVQLLLVGDGPERRALEESARQRSIESSVIFAGAINQDNIRRFYGQADVFVLASFAEGVPVVLMEAMALEVPCIATWVAGIPELIRDGIDGLLVPPANAKALAKAVTLLMDDAGLRASLAKAGRVRVGGKYNFPVNLARLADVFTQALEQAA